MTASHGAEIYDRGYRPYDGPRTGISTSVRSVYWASIQRALGLRRKFRFKLVPIATIVIAYIPALAFMGFAVLFPADIAREAVVEYAGYFGLLSIASILFTAFVAPELLCTDRRTGMFGLYMASPLNKVHYLFAKIGALISVVSLVTMFPVLFLLLGYSFAGIGPDGFVDTIEVACKAIVSGLLIALFFSLIGMAASTLTNRQGFASAGIVMVMIASGVFAGVLVEQADAPKWVQLFAFAALPADLAGRIFNESGEQFEGVSGVAAWGMWAAVCLVCAAVIAWGYRRLQVTK